MTKKNRISYKQDYKRYILNTKKPSIDSIQKYIENIQAVHTIDLRNQKNLAKKYISKETIGPDTFIFIDGPSMSGKTTFAKRLEKHIDGKVIDIDYIAIQHYLKVNPNQEEAIKNFSLEKLNKDTDIFIINNLEKIIKKEKDKNKNKPIILVGSYVQLLTRCIVMKTIGRKLFLHTISIFCCEKEKEDYKSLYSSRQKRLHLKPDDTAFEIAYKNVEFANKLISNDLLGFGADCSLVIDTKISDEFQK